MIRFATVVICAVLAIAGTSHATVDFTGSYTVPSAGGPMTLTLEQSPNGTVTGTIVMPGYGGTCNVLGSMVRDEDEEWAVEGSIACADGRSDFVFSEDEDGGFVLLVIPYDETDTPRSDLAAVFYAQRGTAEQHPQADTVAGDPRLAGVWSTQVVMNTPGGGVATQLLMEIRADGTLVDLGSRSAGGIPGAGIDTGTQGGGDVVAWRTEGNVLQVSYAGSQWVALATFEVTGDRLFLVYYDGDQKLWYRR